MKIKCQNMWHKKNSLCRPKRKRGGMKQEEKREIEIKKKMFKTSFKIHKTGT